jgi:hypothetical protein
MMWQVVFPFPQALLDMNSIQFQLMTSMPNMDAQTVKKKTFFTLNKKIRRVACVAF